MNDRDGHQIPVKVYKSDRRLTVAAPMPGVEPQDIAITLNRNGELVLDAAERGRFKDENEVLINEWEAGGYHRTVVLHHDVDATAAEASYDNGVLVVSLPLSQMNQPGRIDLERITATEGRHGGGDRLG